MQKILIFTKNSKSISRIYSNINYF